VPSEGASEKKGATIVASLQPEKGALDVTAEKDVRARFKRLDTLEQQGDALTNDEREELNVLRSWRDRTHFFAVAQEQNPEKVEITYSSDEDRALTEAAMRVVHEPRAAARPASAVVTRKPVRTVHRAREQRPAGRRRSSCTTSDDDPDSEPAAPSRRCTRRRLTFTVDDHYLIVAVA
jgi:hypothetical protein